MLGSGKSGVKRPLPADGKVASAGEGRAAPPSKDDSAGLSGRNWTVWDCRVAAPPLPLVPATPLTRCDAGSAAPHVRTREAADPLPEPASSRHRSGRHPVRSPNRGPQSASTCGHRSRAEPRRSATAGPNVHRGPLPIECGRVGSGGGRPPSPWNLWAMRRDTDASTAVAPGSGAGPAQQAVRLTMRLEPLHAVQS